MKGTRTKKIKQIKNRINEILNKFSFSIDEKKKINKKPNELYMMCFKKKSQLFVFSLSDAINEVDTKEKNKPKKNNKVIVKNIGLLIFFHQV